jgi:hypothetical protein
MQKQELALRQAEVQIKAKKQQAEENLATVKMGLEKEKVGGQLQLEAMKVGAQIQNEKARIATQEKQVGLKAGMDMAKNKEQMDLQRRQAMVQHLQTFKKEPTKQ